MKHAAVKHAAAVALMLSAATAPASRAQDYLPPAELVPALLARQPEVLAADARVRAARAQAQAAAVGSHEFELGVIPQRRRTDIDGDFNEWEAELSRSIRLPGKAALDREIGHQLLRAAEQRRHAAHHHAAHQLLERWMDWLRAHSAAELADNQLQSIEAEHSAAVRRFELGDAARLDVDLIEAERALLQAESVRAEVQLVAARLALSREFPQLPLPERAPRLPDPTTLPDTPVALSRLVEANHELGRVQATAAHQEAVAARARAERRADPSIGVRMMDERGGQERTLGLVFKLPIGGSYRRARAEAEGAEADAARLDALAMQRDAELEAQLLLATARASRAEWAASHAALLANTAAADRTRRAWELGELDLGERLQAERRLRESARLEYEARSHALEAGLLLRINSLTLWSETADGHHDEHR